MWQPVEIVGGESPLDMDVAVLQPAELLESLLKCCDPPLPFRVRLRAMHQDTEAPHSAALLCPRCERPSCGQAAEEGDELAHGSQTDPEWQRRVAAFQQGLQELG